MEDTLTYNSIVSFSFVFNNFRDAFLITKVLINYGDRSMSGKQWLVRTSIQFRNQFEINTFFYLWACNPQRASFWLFKNRTKLNFNRICVCHNHVFSIAPNIKHQINLQNGDAISILCALCSRNSFISRRKNTL